MPDPRHQLGVDGEALAARWLTAGGWRILARRWRTPEGEVDLVALAPDRVLVGIEVRSRRSRRAGHAAETVDARRVRRLRAALARYCAEAAPPPHRAARIDVVTVELVTSPADAGGLWRLTRTPVVDGW